MSAFIAYCIEKAAKQGTDKGQAKYRAYFVKTDLYSSYKEEVDTILAVDGFEDCIVTE